MRFFCQEERRLGLVPSQRRRLTFNGGKPLGSVQYRWETFSGDGAVEPTTGERFLLEFPPLQTTNVQIFLNAFADHSQDPVHLVLLEKGRCQKAKSLVIPAHVVCLVWPPYRPELNPLERLWQDLKAQWAWVLAATIEAWEHQVETIIRRYTKATLQSLTAYPSVVQAVNALRS